MNVDNLLDLQLGRWTVKARPPANSGALHPVIFLIHGWTGDERSMWVFAPRFPKDALLLAPRAPFDSSHVEFGGYSWVEQRAGQFSELLSFDNALASFEELLAQLAAHFPSADFTKFGLAGFSQGAAFSFALALRQPQRISRLATLAGFLPAGAEPQLASMAKVPVFIAHGTQDETVPLAKAQAARDALSSAGVGVQYCESDTGHKLGANCASLLAKFFTS